MRTLKRDYVATGDQLQSAASRMAEWVLEQDPLEVPYEVGMAAREARDAVDEWTELRLGGREHERAA